LLQCRFSAGQKYDLINDFQRVKERLVDGQAAGLVSWIEDLQSAFSPIQTGNNAPAQHLGKLQLIAVRSINNLLV
jgi:hypothetical protein